MNHFPLLMLKYDFCRSCKLYRVNVEEKMIGQAQNTD